MVSIETFFLPPRRLIELETLENLIQKTHSQRGVPKKSFLLVAVGGVVGGVVGVVGVEYTFFLHLSDRIIIAMFD
jgi:hypothetical protein